jgi:GNAT superfamily N-acetyltransferase
VQTAFGSTYVREAAFQDEDWRRRLYNPIAKTFVAVRTRDRRVLAATTVYGPMPGEEIVSNPNLSTGTTTPAEADTVGGDGAPLIDQLTGVYTRAEARGRGIGKAVVEVAVAYALAEMRRRQTSACKLGVDVYAANKPAISFYEKCGFAVSGPRPIDADSETARPELIMHYRGLGISGST